MADWSALKPLRVHSTFMTIVVLALAAVLFLPPRHAFRTQAASNSSENNNLTSTVKAISGLTIRDQPTTNGTLLTTAPNNEILTIIDKNAAQDVIAGKSGSWYKVEYQGITGYAWGNYIDQ